MKELKIISSEGYEIDKENSTCEHIKFKKKDSFYLAIHKSLFSDGNYFYLNTYGDIKKGYSICVGAYSHLAKTHNQLEQLLAINKLMNVAKYLNDSWEPDWKNLSEIKWAIRWDYRTKKFTTFGYCATKTTEVVFKTEEHAEEAINILGEDVIKTALGVC